MIFPIYTALSSHELYSRFLYFPALFSVKERHACVSQWAKAELSLVRYFERPITSLSFLSLTGHFHCELLFLECFIVPLIRWWKDCGYKGSDYQHWRFYWSVTIWGDFHFLQHGLFKYVHQNQQLHVFPLLSAPSGSKSTLSNPKHGFIHPHPSPSCPLGIAWISTLSGDK